MSNSKEVQCHFKKSASLITIFFNEPYTNLYVANVTRPKHGSMDEYY